MNISKIIFICKKQLIKLIERIPVQRNTQTDDERNLPFLIPLEIGGHLLRNLSVTEDSFRSIAGYSQRDAKSYYLYLIVSEVVSSCMSCIRVAGWIAESEEETKFGYPKANPGNETISGRRVHHLFHRSIVDEFEIRFRKLQEYLCNLICFSEAADQKYFKLFLTAEALSDIRYANQDITEFFGKSMGNFNFQSKELLTRCKALADDLDRDKCWFLNSSITFDSNLGLNIMSSIKQRYKKALSIATSGEKIVLGPTYKVGYGGSSKSAHALAEEHFKDFTVEDVKHAINKIPVICINVLSRAFEIADIEYPQKFKQILDSARSGGSATKELKDMTQRDLEIGDLATTDGSDVAEILEVYISSYGYTSYRVRYLINPKIEEIIEEWLPPRYIGACLLRSQGVRDFFIQNVIPLLKIKGTDWIEKQTDEALYNYAKDTILRMAQEGHLKLFFGDKPKSNFNYRFQKD
ncbi:MAG: DUF5677 domain-containing protein [Candidatus Omnitrophica bacterium]|jgi:hypothetical protein|nr:DUF5677 domain-containing protein [Candidatus Omnitrophota bacterium]